MIRAWWDEHFRVSFDRRGWWRGVAVEWFASGVTGIVSVDVVKLELFAHAFLNESGIARRN